MFSEMRTGAREDEGSFYFARGIWWNFRIVQRDGKQACDIC